MLRKRAVCQLRQVKSKKQSAWRLYLVNEGKSSFEPVWVAALAALPTVRSKMTHAAEKRRELTSEAMKRQRTGAMIMMTEKLLWQESELKMSPWTVLLTYPTRQQLAIQEFSLSSPNGQRCQSPYCAGRSLTCYNWPSSALKWSSSSGESQPT